VFLHQAEDAMEDLIATLLKDFEDGKMTRRQLIQSLALAATAAASGTTVAAQSATKSTIPPPTGPAPWKTVWLDHISYAVSDYRKSTAFYRDLMGWEIKNDEGTRQCTLKIGDIGEIIIRNRREPGANAQSGQSAANGQPAGAQQAQANRPLTGVINHISWGVQPWDTDKVKAELEKRGLNPRPDMVGDNFKSFHVLDPDGWDLQISNQTKDTRS
jgi:catechol 2,3-dioxygenase-like lactoylglutathione lyase family enzyme